MGKNSSKIKEKEKNENKTENVNAEVIEKKDEKKGKEKKESKNKTQEITKTKSNTSEKNNVTEKKVEPKKQNKNVEKNNSDTKEKNKKQQDNNNKNNNSTKIQENANKKNTVKKDSNKKNLDNKNTDKKSNENKDIEKKNIEEKSNYNKNIEKKNTEKDIAKNSEKQYSKQEKKGKNKVVLVIILILLILLVLVIAGIFTIPSIITETNNKIIYGILINDINVEQLTAEEANELLNNKAEDIVNSDIKIVMGEYENNINLAQISAEYNFKDALDEANNIGRSSNIFKNSYDILMSKYQGKNIDVNIEVNEEELNNVFNNISQELPGHVIQWSYSVDSGKKLIITKGTKGIVIDEEETKKRIKEALINALKGEKINNIELATKEVEPEAIDVDKIHDEIYREPQNAYVTQNPFGVYVHVDGIDFDVNEVKQLVTSEEQEYKIDLTITSPEVTTKDLGQEAFPDVLGRTYKTTYSANDINRNTNIEIAARTVNGIILMPGETFSYNGILGDTTADKGYKPAGAYLNGQVIQSYGGGICQVSSTIYNAVLYANLEVNERYNHTFLSGYVPAGLDATVSYGSKDFKFTNNRKYPIKLVCTAGNGTITATIYGVKQDDDIDVELQSTITSYISPKVTYEKTNTLAEGVEKVKQAGSTGCNCTVYITKSKDGNQISREVLHSDVYSAKPKIILKGTKKAEN